MLAGELDSIIHSGASVNLVRSYQSLKPVNVLGTQVMDVGVVCDVVVVAVAAVPVCMGTINIAAALRRRLSWVRSLKTVTAQLVWKFTHSHVILVKKRCVSTLGEMPSFWS